MLSCHSGVDGPLAATAAVPRIILFESHSSTSGRQLIAVIITPLMAEQTLPGAVVLCCGGEGLGSEAQPLS